LELATSDITVNCIAPGAIYTPMLKDVAGKIREKMIEKIPMKRFGTPKDIANVHMFLCVEAASYMTGQVLTVDGGMSVGM